VESILFFTVLACAFVLEHSTVQIYMHIRRLTWLVYGIDFMVFGADAEGLPSGAQRIQKGSWQKRTYMGCGVGAG
jgi:hypothetical protein